jgi:hypothetical protein
MKPPQELTYLTPSFTLPISCPEDPPAREIEKLTILLKYNLSTDAVTAITRG